MSDIIRVKVHSRKRHGHSRHGKRAKSLASGSKKFENRFPRLYRAFKKFSAFFKNHLYFGLSLLLLTFGILLNALFALFPLLARDYSDSLGHFFRTCLATLSSIFPFSVGELFFLSFLLYLPLWLVFAGIALHKKYTLHRIHRKLRRVLLAPVAALCAVLCIFVYTFAPSYMSPPVSKTLGLHESDIYENDLYDTLDYFVAEINKDLEKIEFDQNGSSIMPYDFSALATEVNLNFHISDSYAVAYPASGTPAKELIFSDLFAKFGIAGVYSFYTGEANVSTALPDFCLPFNAAHELAHQRGIASENDANLIAFAVCSSSTDHYVRYSAHLNVLLRMRDELKGALENIEDEAFANEVKENVNEILAKLDPQVESELNAYNDFFNAHYSEELAGMADELNDAYLKSQGQTAGSDSYQYITASIVNFYTYYLA